MPRQQSGACLVEQPPSRRRVAPTAPRLPGWPGTSWLEQPPWEMLSRWGSGGGEGGGVAVVVSDVL